jgi:hypothetical protein
LKFSKNVKYGDEEDKLDPDVINKLRNYRGVSALKKACMNMLVKMLEPKEIEILREQFAKIDKDGTGMITVKELQEAMVEAAIPISE